MRQIYVSQPNEEGYYEVAKWNYEKEKYIPIEKHLSEQDAKERAHFLNIEAEEDDK